MIKLDKKFHGLITKAKDNSIVPQDEYVVFLAKDNAFAAILPAYRRECIERGCDADQIALTDELIENVNTWREQNPKRLKNPDAKDEMRFK